MLVDCNHLIERRSALGAFLLEIGDDIQGPDPAMDADRSKRQRSVLQVLDERRARDAENVSGLLRGEFCIERNYGCAAALGYRLQDALERCCRRKRRRGLAH